MPFRRLVSLGLFLGIVLSSLGLIPWSRAEASPALPQIAFAPLGTYATGLGAGSAETVAFSRMRMFVTNTVNNSLDIVDIRNPANPTLISRIDLSQYGAGPNSVAARNNLVAVAVESSPKTAPGKVVLFDRDGRFLNQYVVGALPDMLTFSPKGDFILVASE